MSLSSKQVLYHNLKTKFEAEMETEQAVHIIALLADELSCFEVEQQGDSTPSSNGEMLETFLSVKRLEGKTERTLSQYKYVINKLLDYVQVSVNDVTVFHMRDYLTIKKKDGLSNTTLSGYRAIYSSFFGWLYREGLIQSNPTNNLGKIKKDKKVKKPYTDVDVEKLKENCKSDRDKALICFLLSTGCRVSEVVALDKSNVDFDKQECVVYGKGEKERTVYFDDVTSMLLKRYLDSRTDTKPALFIGKGTDRLHKRGIEVLLNRVANRANVERVHPHRFRRTLATNLVNKGMPVQEVARLLGHEDINTTMCYVCTDAQGVKNNYRKFVF